MGVKSEQAAPEPANEGELQQAGQLSPRLREKTQLVLPLRYKVTSTTGKPSLSGPYPLVSALLGCLCLGFHESRSALPPLQFQSVQGWWSSVVLGGPPQWSSSVVLSGP